MLSFPFGSLQDGDDAKLLHKIARTLIFGIGMNGGVRCIINATLCDGARHYAI